MYPVILTVPHAERVSRWRLLLRPIMLIPHFFWLAMYGIPVGVALFVSFWVIIFTGVFPRGMYEFVSKYYRYYMRVIAYSYFLTDVYPPFNGDETEPYSVRVHLDYPEKYSRLSVFFRSILCFPHFFFYFFYFIAFEVVMVIAFWIALILGRLPDSIFQFMKRFFIYYARLEAYIMLLSDEYPPFHGLQPLVAERANPDRITVAIESTGDGNAPTTEERGREGEDEE